MGPVWIHRHIEVGEMLVQMDFSCVVVDICGRMIICWGVFLWIVGVQQHPFRHHQTSPGANYFLVETNATELENQKHPDRMTLMAHHVLGYSKWTDH